MQDAPRIVAVGLLSERDLGCLGAAFDRGLPVPDDDIFSDLVKRLDAVEIAPLGKGVVLISPPARR